MCLLYDIEGMKSVSLFCIIETKKKISKSLMIKILCLNQTFLFTFVLRHPPKGPVVLVIFKKNGPCALS